MDVPIRSTCARCDVEVIDGAKYCATCATVVEKVEAAAVKTIAPIEKIAGAAAAGIRLIASDAKIHHKKDGRFVVDALGSTFEVTVRPARCECGSVDGIRWVRWTAGILAASGTSPRPSGDYLLCAICRAKMPGKEG